MDDFSSLVFSAVPPRLSNIGVSMGPGLITFTRIFRAFRSAVHVRAKDRTAALVALYTLVASSPMIDATDAVRITEPPSGINGTAFWTEKSSPFTLLLN